MVRTLQRAAAGNKRPIWRETGSAWASDFLFVEFLPGESERRSGARLSREAEASSLALGVGQKMLRQVGTSPLIESTSGTVHTGFRPP